MESTTLAQLATACPQKAEIDTERLSWSSSSMPQGAFASPLKIAPRGQVTRKRQNGSLYKMLAPAATIGLVPLLVPVLSTSTSPANVWSRIRLHGWQRPEETDPLCAASKNDTLISVLI